MLVASQPRVFFVFFSPEAGEKERVATWPVEGETVLDLYAGAFAHPHAAAAHLPIRDWTSWKNWKTYEDISSFLPPVLCTVL